MPRYTVSQKKNGFPVIYADGFAWLSLECRDKADQIAAAMNQFDPKESRQRIVVEIGADISGLEEAMEAARVAVDGAGLDRVGPADGSSFAQHRMNSIESRLAALENVAFPQIRTPTQQSPTRQTPWTVPPLF